MHCRVKYLLLLHIRLILYVKLVEMLKEELQRMKKFFSVLIIIMLLSAAGCSCKNRDKADDTPSLQTEVPAADTEAAAEAPESQTALETEDQLPSAADSEAGQGIQTAEEETAAPEGGALPVTAADDENNYLTTYGRLVHYQGYTYFVQQALDNDGTENGYAGSENIYRIRDDEDADPELLAVIPSFYYDNIQQMTVFCMVPYENCLYFIRNSIDTHSGNNSGLRDVFCRLDLDTGEVTDYDLRFNLTVWWLNSFCRSGDRLYMKSSPYIYPNGDVVVPKDYIVFNLKDGTYESFLPDFGLPEKETAEIIHVSDQYIYYIKCISDGYDEIPYGVCRQDRSTGKSEDVCPISDNDAEMVMYMNGSICIYENSETEQLVFIDPDSGKQTAVLDPDDFHTESAFAISGNTAYFFDRNNDLSMQELTEGAEKTMLMPGGDRVDPLMVSTCGEWIWYMNDDDNAIYRVKNTGRILPGSPLVPAITWEDRYEEQNAGDFAFIEYPNCIEIRGYNGSEESVTIPDTINGKPVKFVSWWAYNHEGKNVKTLYIPEGVVSIGAIEDRSLEEVFLPSTVKHLCSNGYRYTFTIQNGGTLHYNGTVSAWDEVCIFSSKYHDVATDTSGTENLSVVCTDGTWVPEE